jgi:hypothetical protein
MLVSPIPGTIGAMTETTTSPQIDYGDVLPVTMWAHSAASAQFDWLTRFYNN